VRTLLTIAGTDPTSGAGVTADLQVFGDFGYHGLWVPTAAIDQDSASIHDIHALPAVVIGRMVRRISQGGRPSGVKVGVLFSAEAAERVAESLAPAAGGRPVVVDPVLASGLGDTLARADLVSVLREQILPISTLLTPNIPEAEQLIGRSITDLDSAGRAARELVSFGARAVLIKGGHLPGAPGDVLCVDDEVTTLPNEEHFVEDVHGTGCHLSSAITALLADGLSIPTAVRRAREYLSACVRSAKRLDGEGQAGRLLIVHGPLTRRVASDLQGRGASSTPV